MEIRVLRYFLAVAREENITRAAESLHIAQPSLSKQLMELERELGKQLNIRGKRKITLTEDGVLLRQRAEEIVSLVEKTQNDISHDSEEISGNVYIGGGVNKTILSIAARLKQKCPGIQYHFYSGDANDVLERLNHGNLDYAVILEPVDKIKYDCISLPEDSEWGILMQAGDELADKEYITRDILKNIPLIVHQRIGLQQEIAHWAQTDLESLNIAATYNVVHGSALPYVKSGLGYFLTTKDLLSDELPDDIYFKSLNPGFHVKYALAWKKHSVFGKPAGVFMEELRKELES